MAYSITSPKIGFPDIEASGTVQALPLGTRVDAVDTTYGEGSFIYLPGVANTAIGSPVFFDTKAGTTALSGSGTKGLMAIAMSACGSGTYGWYQTRGAAVIVASSSTAGLNAQLSANAGTISSVTSGSNTTRIENAVFITGTGTPAAGQAVVMIDSPAAQGAT